MALSFFYRLILNFYFKYSSYIPRTCTSFTSRNRGEETKREAGGQRLDQALAAVAVEGVSIRF